MFKRKKKEPKIREPRFKAIRDAYSLTKSDKPWIGSVLALIFVVVLAAGIGIGLVVDHPYYFGFISLPLALLASLFVFSRIALNASFASVEGQMGAAASVLMASRARWTRTAPCCGLRLANKAAPGAKTTKNAWSNCCAPT